MRAVRWHCATLRCPAPVQSRCSRFVCGPSVLLVAPPCVLCASAAVCCMCACVRSDLQICNGAVPFERHGRRLRRRHAHVAIRGDERQHRRRGRRSSGGRGRIRSLARATLLRAVPGRKTHRDGGNGQRRRDAPRTVHRRQRWRCAVFCALKEKSRMTRHSRITHTSFRQEY